jgi:hypothetical protein
MSKYTVYKSDLNPEITHINLDLENYDNQKYVSIMLTHKSKNIPGDTMIFTMFNKNTLIDFIDDLNKLKDKL